MCNVTTPAGDSGDWGWDGMSDGSNGRSLADSRTGIRLDYNWGAREGLQEADWLGG